MPENLHRWLLERIARHRKPIFHAIELADYPEAELSHWLNAGVLKRTDAPRRVWKVCEDGTRRELEVFKHGDGFFGHCTDPEEALDVVALNEIDLSRYRLSRSALAAAIAEANRFDPVDFDEDEALPCIAEIDGHAVFLLQPVVKFDDLLPRLHMLASQLGGEGGVIVSPVRVPIPINQRKTLASLGFQIFEMGTAGKDPFRVDYRPDAVAEDEDETEIYTMEHTGSAWLINFLGEEFTVSDTLGARYVAHLLAHPAVVFEATKLRNFLYPHQLEKQDTHDSALVTEEPIEVSTDENVLRLRNKRRSLIADRDCEVDRSTIAKISKEIEEIETELKRVLTRHGTIRREGGTVDKDRKSVSNAVNQRFYKAVEKGCPACFRYFKARVDLGFECTFAPAKGEVWKVKFPRK